MIFSSKEKDIIISKMKLYIDKLDLKKKWDRAISIKEAIKSTVKNKVNEILKDK